MLLQLLNSLESTATQLQGQRGVQSLDGHPHTMCHPACSPKNSTKTTRIRRGGLGTNLARKRDARLGAVARGSRGSTSTSTAPCPCALLLHVVGGSGTGGARGIRYQSIGCRGLGGRLGASRVERRRGAPHQTLICNDGVKPHAQLDIPQQNLPQTTSPRTQGSRQVGIGSALATKTCMQYTPGLRSLLWQQRWEVARQQTQSA